MSENPFVPSDNPVAHAHADPTACTRGFAGTPCPACMVVIAASEARPPAFAGTHDHGGSIDLHWSHETPEHVDTVEVWVKSGDGPWHRVDPYAHVEIVSRRGLFSRVLEWLSSIFAAAPPFDQDDEPLDDAVRNYR